MIYPEDSIRLNWADGKRVYRSSLSANSSYNAFSDTHSKGQYDFLISMPLELKRSMFQAVNHAINNRLLVDVFQSSEQLQWALSIIKFGLVLPLENVELIKDAFNHLRQLYFVMHGMEFHSDGNNITLRGHSNEVEFEVSIPLMRELISTPGVLFNPHLFLAKNATDNVGNGRMYRMQNSFGSASTPPREALYHASVPSAPLEQKVGADPPKVSDINRTLSAHGRPSPGILQHADSASESGVTISIGIKNALPLLTSPQPPISSADFKKSLKLWEKYVEFLSHVLQVHSTLVRAIQANVPSDIINTVFGSLLNTADLILSQGGKNPRLRPWVAKYRTMVGPQLWDQTWGTIGDRLEAVALKLAIDIWGRSITLENVCQDTMLRLASNWIHRDNVMAVWLQVSKQVAMRVVRAYYPHDLHVGSDRLFVYVDGYSLSGTTSDKNAKAMLDAYASTTVDVDVISSWSYCLYAKTMCEIIQSMLSISKIVRVDEREYIQVPPTANYIIDYYGKQLFKMASFEYMPSADFIIAKRNVITILIQLLTFKDNPQDPLKPEYRLGIMMALNQAILDNRQVQAVLPNVPLLLKNSSEARMFIPMFFDLAFRVLPVVQNIYTVIDENVLRKDALDTISALIPFIEYYHSIGQSQMIDSINNSVSVYVVERMNDSNSPAMSGYLRKNIECLVNRVNNCPFTEVAKKDAIYVKYVRAIFQTLLCSVFTEKDPTNMQYITYTIISFLHHYVLSNPGYLKLFVMVYIEQLRVCRHSKIVPVYIYGLTQAATVTWQNAVDKDQYRSIFSALISILSNCDEHLTEYTNWSPYHQRFISSIRCLSMWASTTTHRYLMSEEDADKLMALSTRCTYFIKEANMNSAPLVTKRGMRVNLTTAECQEDANSLSNEGYNPAGDSLVLENYITTYTASKLFGYSTAIIQTSEANNSLPKPLYTLSRSLYKALDTTIGAFSTLVIRDIDKYRRFGCDAPNDTSVIRAILHCSPSLPNIELLLNDCSSTVVKLLEGYVPVEVDYVANFRQMVYSKINFKRLSSNGTWSNPISLSTGRYPSGSKQWLLFLAMPVPPVDPFALNPDKPTETNGDEDAEPSGSQPWIRKTMPLDGTRPWRFSHDIPGLQDRMANVTPLVDDKAEKDIERLLEADIARMHTARGKPDVSFNPVYPGDESQKGNNVTRYFTMETESQNGTILNISESMLEEMDELDDMDRLFSAQVALVYLHDNEAMVSKHSKSKGPLNGVSAEFNHFLNLLNQSHLSTDKGIGEHPEGPASLRYTFCVNNFEVGYNLAPNVSALINHKEMGPHDNDRFYKWLRRYDGITVIWYGSYLGSLDTELAWWFLDRQSSKDADTSLLHLFSMATDKDRDEHFTPTPSPPAPMEQSEPNEFLGLQHRRRSKSDITQPSHLSVIKEQSTNSKTEPSSPQLVSTLRMPSVTSQHRKSSEGDSKFSRLKEHPCKIKPKAKEIIQRAIYNRRKKAEKNAELGRDPRHSSDGVIGEMDKPGLVENRSRQRSSSLVGSRFTNVTPDAGQTKIQPEAESSSINTSKTKVSVAETENKQPSTKHHKRTNSNNTTSTHNASSGDTEEAEPPMRIIIGLAPVHGTGGRLTKVVLSARGASTEFNEEFIRMTGPLTPVMVVETKRLPYLLSATILDASANMASMNCEDFSMVSKRAEKIKSIIDKHCLKTKSASDLNKFMFPVGKNGLQSTLQAYSCDVIKQSAPLPANNV